MKAFALIEQNFWKGQGKILDFSSKNVESVTVTEALGRDFMHALHERPVKLPARTSRKTP
jgi:hypothetical protein